MTDPVQYFEESGGRIAAFKRTLEDVAANIAGGNARLVIPEQRDGDRFEEYGHYHARPEVFVQLSGVTSFMLPAETIHLRRDEICVMPKFVYHAERVRSDQSEPAFYLICGFNVDNHLSLHFSDEKPSAPGMPGILHSLVKQTPEGCERTLRFLEQIVDFHRDDVPYRDTVLKGLSLAFFISLLKVAETWNENEKDDRDHRVRTCVRLILSHLDDPGLNVPFLAKQTDCSANYLSNLFHKETGTTLTSHIRQRRVEKAKELLAHSKLGVKQVAWACGFNDPSYFISVFKKTIGETPNQFRQARPV